MTPPTNQTAQGPPLIYISLGAGVQSTALLAMSALGLRGVPRADLAIFADTGDEPAWVYDHLARLEPWSAEKGVPIRRVSAGHLGDDFLSTLRGGHRAASIPAWAAASDGRKGILHRQCTRDYKIRPITRYLRRMLIGESLARPRPGAVVALIGISLDEFQRMKPSRVAWIVHRWPLVDARMTRADCETLIRDVGLQVPQKSACVFCPYHDDRYWRDLKERHPEEWERATAFDAAIRDGTRAGLKMPLYLHKSLRPLAEVQFTRDETPDMFENECEGRCGN